MLRSWENWAMQDLSTASSKRCRTPAVLKERLWWAYESNSNTAVLMTGNARGCAKRWRAPMSLAQPRWVSSSRTAPYGRGSVSSVRVVRAVVRWLWRDPDNQWSLMQPHYPSIVQRSVFLCLAIAALQSRRARFRIELSASADRPISPMSHHKRRQTWNVR